MDFFALRWRVDPGGDRFSGRAWRHFDEAFWVGLEGVIEDFLAGVIDLFGLAEMDLIRRHQADAGMMVATIVPVEEVAAEGLCVLDAAEAPWAPQLISQAPATEVAHSTSVSCRQRRIIETLFADLKTKSFNLKDTRIGDPRLLSTLSAVLALAVTLCVRIGVAAGRPRPMPLK